MVPGIAHQESLGILQRATQRGWPFQPKIVGEACGDSTRWGRTVHIPLNGGKGVNHQISYSASAESPKVSPPMEFHLGEFLRRGGPKPTLPIQLGEVRPSSGIHRDEIP